MDTTGSAGRACPRRRQRGFTLVEATVVAAVTAVALGAALPSFRGTIELRTITGMAAEFETDVHYARSEAQARAQPVRLTFPAQTAGSCYVIHTGPSSGCRCDATGRAECSGGAEVLRTVFLAGDKPVTMASNARSMLFDARRQTVTPAASITIAGRSGHSLKQVVNIMGRVRSCSPNRTMPGYKAC